MSDQNGGGHKIAQGTRLVLVRHGESQCNVAGVVGGHKGCSGLTNLGRRQAEALGERLAETGELAPVAAIYTSVLKRSIETAEILAPYVGQPPMHSSCDLCEQHPGEADGLDWVECREAFGAPPEEFDPSWRMAPGSESYYELGERVERTILEIAASHPGETVMIVAHGGVVDSSLTRLMRVPMDATSVRLYTQYASLTEWQHTGSRWRLARYNDAAHLGALTPPSPPWVTGAVVIGPAPTLELADD